ncbi:inositol polyphosphate kinase-domain-containing protein [Rhizophagus diaphanus]|nr:inositol polyphosphate kinase-domain-containing protein [Rhizophagus diaphanus] [Rhizophagus sp. MUCL 43196]
MSSQEATFQKFDRQIGGHDKLLSVNDGFLIVKPCNSIEKTFYENSVLYPDFAEWIPKYYGSLQLQGVQSESNNLETIAQNVREGISSQQANVTEVDDILFINLIYKFKKPCIMDLKLGTQLWGEDADEAKRQRMTKKSLESTSSSLGIRIVAFQVYRKSSDSFFNFTREDGYKSTAKSIVSDLAEFFTSEIPIDHRRIVIERFINDLESSLRVLEKQEIRLIGASLFFVYEGDPDTFAEALNKEQEQNHETKIYNNGYTEEEIEEDIEEEEGEEEKEEEIEEEEDDTDSDYEDTYKITDLKVIDFAHSFFREGIGKDEGVLLGLNNTVKYFKQILNEEKYH